MNYSSAIKIEIGKKYEINKDIEQNFAIFKNIEAKEEWLKLNLLNFVR